MSITPRPVLWSGINLEVEGLSWSGAVCRTELRCLCRQSQHSVLHPPPLCVNLELANALVKEWGNISQQEQVSLVQSMTRYTAVFNAAGGHSRY